MKLLPWLQSYMTRCRGYGVTQPVAMVQSNRTSCRGYRVIERVAIVTE